MTKRKNPATSLDAYRALTQDQLNDHHTKILKALEKGAASAEQIAARINLTHVQTNRRISELSKKELIYNTKLRVATATGRTAFVWALCKPGQTPQKETVSVLPGKSVSEYSKEITKTFIQPSLF